MSDRKLKSLKNRRVNAAWKSGNAKIRKLNRIVKQLDAVEFDRSKLLKQIVIAEIVAVRTQLKGITR